MSLSEFIENNKWETLRRSIAEQVAVKNARVYEVCPEDVGEYAVAVANMVIKGLKESYYEDN